MRELLSRATGGALMNIEWRIPKYHTDRQTNRVTSWGASVWAKNHFNKQLMLSRPLSFLSSESKGQPGQPQSRWRKLPMKWSLSDSFLTILMELDPPTILPCIVHIMRMIFTFYSVSFWPSWSKICFRKGSNQNGNFGDGSRTVWPATRAKSVKMSKTFSPLKPSLWWLGDGQKKLHFVHSAQSYGGSKFNV